MAGHLMGMKFNRQEGNNYYFDAGFYNEGLDFVPQFGGGGLFPAQPALQEVLSGGVPPVLSQGEYVGAYQVPTDLYIRGATGEAWL